MADAGFNRATLTSPTVEPRRPGFGGLGALVLVLVLAGAGFVGYKIIQSGAPAVAAAQQDRNLAKIQQQLTSIEQRLDHLERRRAAAQPASIAPQQKTTDLSAPSASSAHVAQKQSAESSELKPEAPSHAAQTEAETQSEPAPQLTKTSSTSDSVATREAWQATANQLTDVVGVVGSQQDELSKTQEEVGKLAAQAQRFAVPFQLRRGSRPQIIGPVSLQLKNADERRQRYSVDVFLDEKPVEFKDRAVDELVDFILPGQSAPMRFVATRINHDSISGYMEVPSRGTPR